MRAILRLLGEAAAACAAGVAACSGPAADHTVQSEPSRTHLVATVQRQALTGQPSTDELSVLLSVLKMPQTLNGDRLLRLMGLMSDLPSIGTCEVVDIAVRASPPLSSVERIELLDVGDVTVASGKRSLPLARQAFPTVTDFISGVIYTSRDKHADLLPLQGSISVRARGASKLKAFTIDIPDLPRLDRVRLDGTPLLQVTRLAADNSFELQWEKGSPGDVVWVEYGADNGRKVVSCAYDDTLGAAKVPGGLTNELGDARLTLHRLHRESISVPGFDRADIRFDSRLAQPVTLF